MRFIHDAPQADIYRLHGIFVGYSKKEAVQQIGLNTISISVQMHTGHNRQLNGNLLTLFRKTFGLDLVQWHFSCTMPKNANVLWILLIMMQGTVVQWLVPRPYSNAI